MHIRVQMTLQHLKPFSIIFVDHGRGMDTKFLEKRGVDMDMKKSVNRGVDMDMVMKNSVKRSVDMDMVL